MFSVCIKYLSGLVWASDQDASGLHISSSPGTFWDFTEGAGKRGWGEGRLDYLTEPDANMTQPRISDR